MLLTVDVGNTTVAVGGFRGPDPAFVHRLPSRRDMDAQAWTAALTALLHRAGCPASEVEGTALSSVVPAVTQPLSAALTALTGRPVLTVDHTTPLDFSIPRYDRSALGMDRVVDCAAALSRWAPPLAVFDLGTATTLTVINDRRELVGGMILPGLRLSLDALSARAAQLPPVELTPPAALLGTDTCSCMNCGALYGAAGAVEGITARLEEELGALTLVLTGGRSGHVFPLLRRPAVWEPHLLLLGLRSLWHQNLPH